MKIRGLYSYLEFMEEVSDDFVQINIDTMVSKNKLDLQKEELLNIEEKLDIILEILDSLDVSSFNSYQLFPKLKYRWNKYLLAGIIRSYFNEKFVVENTDNHYDKTDFIIKRI